MKVDVSAYCAANGKLPRGRRYWWFRFAGMPHDGGMWGTWAEAEAWALAEAKRFKVKNVEVLP